MADKVKLADKYLLPVLLMATGIILVLSGERDIGLMMLALGAGIPMPQRASHLRPGRR